MSVAIIRCCSSRTVPSTTRMVGPRCTISASAVNVPWPAFRIRVTGLKSSWARARPPPAETNRVPRASIIVPRAPGTIVSANASGDTSRLSAKLTIDVAPARFAQEQAQERRGQREGRARGERAGVRLHRIDARTVRDGARPAGVEHRTEGPLSERGAQEAPEVHDRDRDAGELGWVHLAAERPGEHEGATERAHREEERGHAAEREHPERRNQDEPQHEVARREDDVRELPAPQHPV